MTAIELSHVSMRWDQRRVLDDVSLTVDRGDFMVITGPNGGGKSTLLRIMLKLLKPTCGKVDYYSCAGDAVSRLPIGYLPQKNLIDHRFPITVEEVISSGLLGHKHIRKSEAETRVREVVAMMGLEDHSGSPIGHLSGGQLQRSLLGRALISRPEILVLDEPLSYVDRSFSDHLYDILGCLHGEGTTIVAVSHELRGFGRMATRHIYVDRNIRYGDPD